MTHIKHQTASEKPCLGLSMMPFQRRINKKGSFDLIILIIFLVGAAIAGLIGMKIVGEVTSELNATVIGNNTNAVTAMNAAVNTSSYLDYFVLWLYIGSFLGLVISSLYIDVHPVFFVFFIILYVLAIILSGMFANMYIEVASDAEFAAESARFVFSGWIFDHLPLLIAIAGAVEIIVLYAKTQMKGGGI